jgi:uncharacterized delta-60 repeat protein
VDQTSQFVLEDVTARAGEDYVPQSGSVTFTSPSAGGITVGLIDSPVWRPNRTFAVRLVNPGDRVVLGQNDATVTIMDDDTVVAPFRRTDGSITLVLAVTGKRWLVVGGFTDIDGYQRNGLARLETDGALDTSFDPAQSADGPIRAAVEQHDGKVLVGGSFLNFAAQPRVSVARIMASGALDNTFVPQIKGPCSVQELLLQSDGKVLVAGSGLSTATVTNTGLLRLNTDGSVDFGFVPPSAITNAQVMSLQADGKVLVTGPFGLITRLNPDGSTDPGFAAQLPTNQGLAMAGVSAIAPFPDGRILLGGSPYYTEKDMALVTLTTNGDLAAVQVSLRVPNIVGPGLAQVTDCEILAFGFQPDGHLLLSGFWEISSGGETGILRLNPDLTQDLSFAWLPGAFWSMSIQSDGTFGGIGNPIPQSTMGVGRISIRQADGRIVQDLRFSGIARLPDGEIHFGLRGYAPSAGVMQTSTDLTNWYTITNSSAMVQGMVFQETTATNDAQRFYRAVTQ